MCCRNDISCTKQTMARGKKFHTDTKLCTTKFAQSISQYNYVLQSVHFVLQNLHKALPSTTFCTTKFARSTSQYYFVLQSLHKALSNNYYFVLQSLHKGVPSTTLYYKVCTKAFPVLLCTTKFAQSNSQYHFVLQSLHQAVPNTTSHIFALQSSDKQTMLKHVETLFNNIF